MLSITSSITCNWLTPPHLGCQICLSANPKDSCSGDSGGPAIWQHPDDKIWYEVGIVSYGPEGQ